MISITETSNDSANLLLEGDLTIYVAEKLDKEMNSCLEKYQKLDVDMSSVGELDTSCYQVLLRAKLISNKNGKEFSVSKFSDQAKEIFDLYDLNEVFLH